MESALTRAPTCARRARTEQEEFVVPVSVRVAVVVPDRTRDEETAPVTRSLPDADSGVSDSALLRVHQGVRADRKRLDASMRLLLRARPGALLPGDLQAAITEQAWTRRRVEGTLRDAGADFGRALGGGFPEASVHVHRERLRGEIGAYRAVLTVLQGLLEECVSVHSRRAEHPATGCPGGHRDDAAALVRQTMSDVADMLRAVGAEAESSTR